MDNMTGTQKMTYIPTNKTGVNFRGLNIIDPCSFTNITHNNVCLCYSIFAFTITIFFL